jgi:hypothetical protein
VSKPTDEKPRKPRGRAIRWTAEDFRRMSRITGPDVARARENFKRLAPKPINRLLDQ